MSLGVWLFSIGSVLVVLGTVQMQREARRDSWRQAEQLVEISRLLRVEPDITKEIVQDEADTRLIIEHLSEPEKHFLSFTVRDPAKMQPQESLRMLRAFAEHFKSPAPGGNPFQQVMGSLKAKALIEPIDGRLSLTTRGKRVVGVLRKNKIPPFDFQ